MPGGDIEKTINPPEVPIWHCSWWGLPCKTCYQASGGLLPHPFTLTCDQRRRFAFCCAIRRVAPPGRYPAPFLCGVRTFLDPEGPRSSSSPRKAAVGAKSGKVNCKAYSKRPPAYNQTGLKGPGDGARNAAGATIRFAPNQSLDHIHNLQPVSQTVPGRAAHLHPSPDPSRQSHSNARF